MTTGMSNEITAANAGGPPRLAMQMLWAARAAEFYR